VRGSWGVHVFMSICIQLGRACIYLCMCNMYASGMCLCVLICACMHIYMTDFLINIVFPKISISPRGKRAGIWDLIAVESDGGVYGWRK
jgi:hypothetical protein